MQRRQVLFISLGLPSIAGCIGDDEPDDGTEAEEDEAGDGMDSEEPDDGTEAEGDEAESDDRDYEDLPEGFSETGIDDIGRVTNRIQTDLTNATFEFVFEPVLTSYNRKIQLQGDGTTGELQGKIEAQDPGAPRDELREIELYSPPEDNVLHGKINYSDGPEYEESERTDFVALLVEETLIEELTYFSYSYLERENYQGSDVYVFDITGPTDEDQWERVNLGTGVPYDEFNGGNTVVNEEGMILNHSYQVTDPDTDETAKPEWKYQFIDDTQISRPDWVNNM